MATDDAMDIESATQGLYMDVEQQLASRDPPIMPQPPPAVASSTSGNISDSPANVDVVPSPECTDSILIARRVVVSFLRECNAEDIIPETSRVALIDSTLTLKQAFRALVENGTQLRDLASAKVVFCGIHLLTGAVSHASIFMNRCESCAGH